jgi:integrase
MGCEVCIRTWDDAAVRWLLETAYKSTAHEDEAKLRWLAQHLGGLSLADVDGDLICRIAVIKAGETSRSTANRYLALVRAILRRAHEVWQWIERRPRILLFPERTRRVRWLTPDQVRVLLAQLPEHQRHVVAFALATGLRQANILALQWHQVDVGRRMLWIPAEQAKGRQAIRIPLAEAALAILQRQVGQHREWVFTYRGGRIRWANTRAWRDALRRVGIEDFRWHDLRHTWASWHAQAGTPLYVLQELGGWQSESMVRRYAHLTPSLFASYAEAVTDCLPKCF